MQNTLTIAWRQFRSYFDGPVAYIVIALLLLIVGVMFWPPFFLMGRATVREMFVWVARLLVIAAPAVTMALIAEERRSGTIELLITMPVRESEVIFGKFLAALGLFGVLLVLTFVYPISVATLGNLDWGAVVTGYIGLGLQGSAMLAIGLMASSFTKNQLMAFFISFALCLLLVIVGFFQPFLSGWVATVAEFISFESQFESMSRGVIDLRNVVYFLSVTTLALMLAFRAIESRRWS